MRALILITFITVPIIEIAILIEVGGALGGWPTLGAVIATAIFGTWMLRIQGISTLGRAQASLAQGRFPANEVFDGLCLVFAGALLLTPGFVTDAFGLLLMAAPFRAALRRRMTAWLETHGRVHMGGMGKPPDASADSSGPVIEGTYEEIDPESPPLENLGRSPWVPPEDR